MRTWVFLSLTSLTTELQPPTNFPPFFCRRNQLYKIQLRSVHLKIWNAFRYLITLPKPPRKSCIDFSDCIGFRYFETYVHVPQLLGLVISLVWKTKHRKGLVPNKPINHAVRPSVCLLRCLKKQPYFEARRIWSQDVFPRFFLAASWKQVKPWAM